MEINKYKLNEKKLINTHTEKDRNKQKQTEMVNFYLKIMIKNFNIFSKALILGAHEAISFAQE